MKITKSKSWPKDATQLGPRPGSGKYEPIRQAILELRPGSGECLAVECDNPKQANNVKCSLLTGRARPSNSLRDVKLSTRIIGSTLWVTRPGEGEER